MQRHKHSGQPGRRYSICTCCEWPANISQAELTGACLHRDLAINLDEGGMPWTCLPGEPANVNWCNGAGGADLYRNPPAAWRGARTQGRVP